MSHCDWYLIYTKAKQEVVTLQNLEQQAYQTYLPTHRARRRLRTQYTLVTEPLFPRYLFIALNSQFHTVLLQLMYPAAVRDPSIS